MFVCVCGRDRVRTSVFLWGSGCRWRGVWVRLHSVHVMNSSSSKPVPYNTGKREKIILLT